MKPRRHFSIPPAGVPTDQASAEAPTVLRSAVVWTAPEASCRTARPTCTLRQSRRLAATRSRDAPRTAFGFVLASLAEIRDLRQGRVNPQSAYETCTVEHFRAGVSAWMEAAAACDERNGCWKTGCEFGRAPEGFDWRTAFNASAAVA